MMVKEKKVQSTGRKTGSGKRRSMDLMIFYLVLILVGIGLMMVFSASYVQAEIRYGDSLHFLKKNLFFSTAGFFLMYGISRVNYKVYKKLALPLMIINVILLIYTLANDPIKGSRRWIRLPGFTLQTSEFTKYSCIIMTATVLSRFKNNLGHLRAFGEPLFYVAVSLGLIMQQRDLSTSMTIFVVFIGMLFVSGMPLLNVLFSMLAVAAPGAAYMAFTSKDSTYQMGRIQSYINSFSDYMQGGHQVIQSLYALASGGIRGLGLGRSRQKFFYLPEPQNDFIFAIIGEELGYIGVVIILLLFAFLIGKCMSLVLKAPDMFGSMLVAGIGLQVGIQILFNVGVVTGLLPNTGIALPFISYGGTSLLVSMAAMGIVLNVSRYRKR